MGTTVTTSPEENKKEKELEEEISDLLAEWQAVGSPVLDRIEKITGVDREDIKGHMVEKDIYSAEGMQRHTEESYEQALLDCAATLVRMM